ncbi:hypothetical protein M422DRAFT_261358 [Sphaerobolus stellatus SS14]|uniref:Uncharacterized protein n=1 Tax=Sphaerobolus stellatus (strain SS14) TaxID=990650 RepID=A0A0C9U0C5_SPHS4|nr:hypothetical protein M422DRAFT_261358 [Sphaerobolus stellatus SS14]
MVGWSSSCLWKGIFSPSHAVEEINGINDIRHFFDSIVVETPLPDYVYALLDVLQRHDVPFAKYDARAPPAVYVQFSKAKDLPQNFTAVGDSVMQVNPIKGQGIAKATAEIVTLN